LVMHAVKLIARLICNYVSSDNYYKESY